MTHVGDRRALNEDEQAGLQLFRGKANCVACHAGPQFSDERLNNTGVTWQNNRFTDVGARRGDFKTPTLPEIARTFFTGTMEVSRLSKQ